MTKYNSSGFRKYHFNEASHYITKIHLIIGDITRNGWQSDTSQAGKEMYINNTDTYKLKYIFNVFKSIGKITIEFAQPTNFSAFIITIVIKLSDILLRIYYSQLDYNYKLTITDE